MNGEDDERRREEVEALEAIYGIEDVSRQVGTGVNKMVEMVKVVRRVEETEVYRGGEGLELVVRFELPEGYPSVKMPIVSLDVGWLSQETRKRLVEECEGENVGAEGGTY